MPCPDFRTPESKSWNSFLSSARSKIPKDWEDYKGSMTRIFVTRLHVVSEGVVEDDGGNADWWWCVVRLVRSGVRTTPRPAAVRPPPCCNWAHSTARHSTEESRALTPPTSPPTHTTGTSSHLTPPSDKCRLCTTGDHTRRQIQWYQWLGTLREKRG